MVKTRLLLDSTHPHLHFVLARFRWLLHFHPLITPPTLDGYGDEASIAEGWYCIPAQPPWRPVDMYTYLGSKLGVTVDHPPEGVAEADIRTLERPLTRESEVWTPTWQRAYILREEVAPKIGADLTDLKRMTHRVEEIWSQSAADEAANKNVRLGALLQPRRKAIRLARNAQIDTELFFSGAVGLVTDYLRCECCGLDAADVLTTAIQGYVGCVESKGAARLVLLEDAVDHLADAVSDLVHSRATATVDEYEYRSYLASLYVRTAQRLIMHQMAPGWTPPVQKRLMLLRSNLDEIFAHDLDPGFTFAARWPPKEALREVARWLALPERERSRELTEVPPLFIDTVQDMVNEPGGSILGLGGLVSIGGPSEFDPIELALWAKYGDRAGTGVASLLAALEHDLHPVSPRLQATGKSFLRSFR